MGVDVIRSIHLQGSPSHTTLKLTTRQPYHPQRLPVSCTVYECFIIKAFSLLLSASLSVCFQLLITLCLVVKKKKKKKRKRSGPFEYSLMDLTGKVGLSCFIESMYHCGVIQHSGCEKVCTN